MAGQAENRWSALRRLWALFELTAEERLFVLGLLAIVLVGLAARYAHLRRQRAEPYQPAGVEQSGEAGGP
ncbi:MAG: hypothetical protein NTV49_15490 [Kiritimatiellaeota bacterium]|nr:hypothetical protein [Kiritimatiellota bacterium]